MLLFVVHQCCLSVLGCKEDKMDVGFVYQNERLEIYPSEQGLSLVVGI